MHDRKITFASALLLVLAFALPTVALETSDPVAQANTPEAGTLTGIVRYSKRVGRSEAFGFETPDNVKPPVDPTARALASAYIYLEPIVDETGSQPEPKSITWADAGKLPKANMNQAGFRFRPQVLVVQAGQRIIFGNEDFQDHNVRAYSEIQRNTFNIITTNTRFYTKKFQAQKSGSPVKLACDFHPSMRGWIYVVDHNRHAVSSIEGTFEIKSIPPGKYTLFIIQPVLRLRSEIEVDIQPGAKLNADTSFGLDHQYYRSEPKIWISETP